MLNPEQGSKLVKLARQAISSYLSKRKYNVSADLRKEFSKKKGAFVTLKINGMLRGCIGIVEDIKPLYQAVADSAVSAASADPRFPSLSKEELKKTTISVSVLSKATAIEVRNPEDYLKHIQVGRDGLIVRGIFNSGLLLPIVAVEQNWDALKFLQQTCLKAGLPADIWQDFNQCRIYKFQTEVFSESSPDGEVIKKM